MEQEKQKAGLYMWLFQEDERNGESLAIDNQSIYYSRLCVV